MLAPGISTNLARFAIGFDHRDRERLHELWDRILDENRWSEGELTREFEERWAARFVSPVASAAPKNVSLKGSVNSLPRPTKAKEKPAGLSQRA